MVFNLQVVLVDDLTHFTVHSVDSEMHLDEDNHCICDSHKIKDRQSSDSVEIVAEKGVEYAMN